MLKEIDLHGIGHSEVPLTLENEMFLCEPPMRIITGNSQKMKSLVMAFLDKHDYKYFLGDEWNQGYIMVVGD